jgi:hypothetical protein
MGRIDGHEVVPASTWSGSKLSYTDLVLYNGSGGPFHSNCHLFKVGKTEWVILPDKVTHFVKRDEPVFKQANLF